PLKFHLETIRSWVQQPEERHDQRQVEIVNERGVQAEALKRVLAVAPFEGVGSGGNRELIIRPADFTGPDLQPVFIQKEFELIEAGLRTDLVIKLCDACRSETFQNEDAVLVVADRAGTRGELAEGDLVALHQPRLVAAGGPGQSGQTARFEVLGELARAV